MYNTAKKFRLASILLALGLLLGSGVVGCSDQDRDKGDTPIVEKATIHYTFVQDTAEKVSKEATNVSVITAYLNEDHTLTEVPNTLSEDVLDDMQQSADGTHTFDITTEDDITYIQVSFYCVKDGVKVVKTAYEHFDPVFEDGSCYIIATDEDAFITAVELYNGDVKTNTFTVGDTVTVKIYDDGEDISEAILPLIYSRDENVVARSTGETVVFKAVGAGDCELYGIKNGLEYDLGDSAKIHVNPN